MDINKKAAIKFNINGSPISYYGNTIISCIDNNDNIYKKCICIQQILANSDLAKKYVFLPPESLHMTIISLCREIDRNTEFWPKYLSVDEKFCNIDNKIKSIVDTILPPKKIKMRIKSFDGCKILLEPYDEETKNKLQDYRNTISEKVDIKHLNHNNYVHHISLVYNIYELNKIDRIKIKELVDNELKKGIQYFHVKTPSFVIFNDMLEYHKNPSNRKNLY